MAQFKLAARIGFNDDDGWNVQMRITNLPSREDAKVLGERFAAQFREFLAAQGATVTEDVVKRDTTLILPDTVQ